MCTCGAAFQGAFEGAEGAQKSNEGPQELKGGAQASKGGAAPRYVALANSLGVSLAYVRSLEGLLKCRAMSHSTGWRTGLP